MTTSTAARPARCCYPAAASKRDVRRLRGTTRRLAINYQLTDRDDDRDDR